MSKYVRAPKAANFTNRAFIVLLIAVAAGCGGGVDGKPIAPPTTPAPEPPPEPPGQPTGIRVVEVGQTFIVWAWDPVEGATGYEVDVFLAGTPPGQPGERIVTEGPRVRVDGLEPVTEAEIYVRAIRETAGGRAAGPWSTSRVAETQGEPLVCTDERELAMNFSEFVQGWDGTPFRVDMIRNFPDVATEEDVAILLDAVRLLDQKIEQQLGYRILEMGDVNPVPAGAPPAGTRTSRNTAAPVPSKRSENRFSVSTWTTRTTGLRLLTHRQIRSADPSATSSPL